MAAQTAAGDVAADEFVLAGGSWSSAMAAQLGLRLPIEAGKGYSLTMNRPPDWPRSPADLAFESRIAVTPMGDKLRFGGTMELSGMNDALRLERVRQIIESAPLYLPEVREADFAEGGAVVRPAAGFRLDGLPRISGGSGAIPEGRSRLAAHGHAGADPGAGHGPTCR